MQTVKLDMPLESFSVCFLADDLRILHEVIAILDRPATEMTFFSDTPNFFHEPFQAQEQPLIA